jgi:hypothetical protein
LYYQCRIKSAEEGFLLEVIFVNRFIISMLR